MGRFTGILGLLTMLGLAYAFSTNRRAIRLKTVAWGLGLQIAFALFVLKVPIGRDLFELAGKKVNILLSYSFKGSEFVFGELGKQGSSLGVLFAFQVLPTIIFIAAFFAVLYHFGVMQFIIKHIRVGDDSRDGRKRSRIAERCRQHLHGTDRGAPYDPPVSSRSHQIGTHDRYDQRHGARVRRNHGGLYRVRHRPQTSPERSHHDGTRNTSDGQDAGA